jgi:hypothetical protein
MKPRNYPEQMSSRDAEWLKLMADLETGRDELEPHQIPVTDEQLLEAA